MIWSSWFASLLWKWNAENRVLATESFRRQFFRYVDRVVMSAVSPVLITSQLLSDIKMARSSAYLYFLDSVSGRSWMQILNNIGLKRSLEGHYS